MNEPQHHGRRRPPPFAVLAVVLLLAGVALVVGALRSQQHAPQPTPAAEIPLGASKSESPDHSPSAGPIPKSALPRGPVLPAAIPTRLDIAAIGVHTDLLQLGLNSDHTVQVPPLSRDSLAGWYKYSPSPGHLGPSVILGHVDSAEYGPAVFFRLGALRPGNTLSITRTDHIVAVFRIERVVSYPKDHFPTLAVYGNTDDAALRLITCGGRFDFTTHNYESNIVAYAVLTGSHPA